MTRPVVLVLAGVNGAGKSSVGGHILAQAGMSWFNPDAFAHELVVATGMERQEANGLAWKEGMRRLDSAMARGSSYAFETTLGGNTVPAKILRATRSADVLMWFCGLSSPEQHIARVQARVSRGGHDIPEDKIRDRFRRAQLNLMGLMPHLKGLKVYDNSAEAGSGQPIPDPVLILEMIDGRLIRPPTASELKRTPQWARPLLEYALSLSPL